MIAKFLGTTSLALLIATLFLYGKWQATKVELVEVRARVEALSSVNDQNQIQITAMAKTAERNSEIIDDLGDRYEESTRRNEEAQTQIANLRLTEAESALAAPFERGNAAYARQRDLLMRFSGDIQRENDPDGP